MTINGTLDLTHDDRPRGRGIVVPVSYTAILTAAMVGVWRQWHSRAADDKQREFPSRQRRLWQDGVIGSIGELVLTTHLKFRWVPCIGPNAITGDVCGVQVKTTDCPHGHLIVPDGDDLHRLFALIEGDAFLVWRIVGWLTGPEFKDDWIRHEQGRKAHWVEQKHLHAWPPPADVCAKFGVHLDRP
jgi:hypothetical protein